MFTNFLTAKWEYLIMANYTVDANILAPYLPPHTTLDLYEGKAVVSVVGFLFNHTKVLGITWPMHKNFEEVNLRFYIKRWDGNAWIRAVAFVSEIVPKRIVATMANFFYNEKYSYATMRHNIKQTDKEVAVSYEWKTSKTAWNRIAVKADASPITTTKNSLEQFILEHYYGYNKYNDTTSIEYSLKHPSWRVYPIKSFELQCDVATLYGAAFVPYITNNNLLSVLMAEGSAVSVKFPKKIKKSIAFI